MKALEEKIIESGVVLSEDILKVGSFLNQQIDSKLLKQIGEEIADIYKNDGVTKLLTIEASGIAIAAAAGIEMGIPFVFAKKNKSSNVSGDVYSTVVHSFTHNSDFTVIVPKDYINDTDRVVIIDDFLANGQALEGLIDIVNQSGAELIGATCAVEKGFQKGGDSLRERGYRIESLAIVDYMSPSQIKFRELK